MKLLGFHGVIFESDSIVLVSALKTNSYDLSEIDLVLRGAWISYITDFFLSFWFPLL